MLQPPAHRTSLGSWIHPTPPLLDLPHTKLLCTSTIRATSTTRTTETSRFSKLQRNPVGPPIIPLILVNMTRTTKKNATSSAPDTISSARTVLQPVGGQLRVPIHLGCPQLRCLRLTPPTPSTILRLHLSLMRRNPSFPSRLQTHSTWSQKTSDLVSPSAERGRPDPQPRHRSRLPPGLLGCHLPCHISFRSTTNTRKLVTSRRRMTRLLRTRIGRTYPSPFVTSFITNLRPTAQPARWLCDVNGSPSASRLDLVPSALSEGSSASLASSSATHLYITPSSPARAYEHLDGPLFSS